MIEDNDPIETREWLDALDALLAGEDPHVTTTNPIGCNLKWKGEEEHWMPPDACDLTWDNR